MFTVGGKISDKNPEQRIGIHFCVKIGKTAKETLLVVLIYGEETEHIPMANAVQGKARCTR